MPKKPIKRGIKAWVRADGHNGYISDFSIYCGKAGDPGLNLGTRVVTELSNTLKHQYYHLYFDNFFTSVTLMETLMQDGIYACGTYRKNRKGLPKDLDQTKLSQLNRGDFLFQQKRNLVANVLRGNRLVYVMSTNTKGDDSTNFR